MFKKLLIIIILAGFFTNKPAVDQYETTYNQFIIYFNNSLDYASMGALYEVGSHNPMIRGRSFGLDPELQEWYLGYRLSNFLTQNQIHQLIQASQSSLNLNLRYRIVYGISGLLIN